MALHNVPLVNIERVANNYCIADSARVDAFFHWRSHQGIAAGFIFLAALTIFINFGMHDFWNEYPNTDAGREMQNFVKNLGIFAGLLVLSASHNISQRGRFFKNFL